MSLSRGGWRIWSIGSSRVNNQGLPGTAPGHVGDGIMCGRFGTFSSAEELAIRFELDDVPDLTPRYNIAPGQPVPFIRPDPRTSRPVLAMVRWGLVPSWAKDPKIGYRMINARSETVAAKPAFRQAYTRRRGLIPADGFYEWSRKKGPEATLFFSVKPEGALWPWPDCGNAGRATGLSSRAPS